jgi:dihydroorotase-like cyclic amidohydrolase
MCREKPAMLTWIQGGRVIDPGHLDTVADIFIKDNKIVRNRTRFQDN